MKALASEPRIFEFRFPKLGTVLKVEVWEDSVVIRSTRNTFSAQRKAAFVRELVSEGFIPEGLLWTSIAGAEAYGVGVRWIVEKSGARQDEARAERTRRIVLRFSAPVALLLAFFVGYAASANPRFMTRPNELIGPRGQHYISAFEDTGMGSRSIFLVR